MPTRPPTSAENTAPNAPTASTAAALRRLATGLTGAATLMMAAGAAQANVPTLERVAVNGRIVEAPTRFDMRASCHALDAQLQEALQLTWERERPNGAVDVRVVMDGSEIADVHTAGLTQPVRRAVRQAVSRLECGPQAQAGAQVYRFSVDFGAPGATGPRLAGYTRSDERLARVSD